MREPFIGSEAVKSGALTPYRLRSRCVALHPDVYVIAGTELSAIARARAAWLWSRRRGIVAGRSAAAVHGAQWVDDRAPAQLLHPHRRPPAGIRTWSDTVARDEVQVIAGLPTTTAARTALDLACRNPVGAAVPAIDALARATALNLADVHALSERYAGRRGITRARRALTLVDAGAQSPRETWLRLLLIEAGFPRPQTQIPVYDPYGVLLAVLDMGWRDIKVAVEYEGDHHRTDRRVFNHDITRLETLTMELGWIVVRVTVEDTRAGILRRVAAARARRT